MKENKNYVFLKKEDNIKHEGDVIYRNNANILLYEKEIDSNFLNLCYVVVTERKKPHKKAKLFVHAYDNDDYLVLNDNNSILYKVPIEEKDTLYFKKVVINAKEC